MNKGEVPTQKTQYYTDATLDGFIATEEDSLQNLFPLGELAWQFHDVGQFDESIVQIVSTTL